MHSDEVIVEQGGGNVFADLGCPNAEVHLLKADLVSRIDGIPRRRRFLRRRPGARTHDTVAEVGQDTLPVRDEGSVSIGLGGSRFDRPVPEFRLHAPFCPPNA